MSNITVKAVETKAEMKVFAGFANKLYKGNAYYVPELEYDVKDTFNEKKNGAYEFCEAQCFLAYRDGKAVGRIAALINHRANETWNVKNVRFGWFDFINDTNVSEALLDAAEEWGRKKGMTQCQGPMGFNDFDREGMLIEGFDHIGAMSTYYNSPYYIQHMVKAGYEKEVDWVQIEVNVPKDIPQKYVRVAQLCEKRYGLKVRKLTGKVIFKENYGKRVFNLLNEAYSPLFGFSKLSDKQVDSFVKQYFQLINLDLVTCVETAEGELVGVGITMGSISHALQKSGGKLLPFGWWPLLRSLKMKMEETVEMLLIAVKPEWQGRGVNAFLFTDLIPYYNKYHFKYALTGPQLESNAKELSQWEYLDPRFPMKRRCWKRSLS